MRAGIDIDAVLQRGHRGRHGPRAASSASRSGPERAVSSFIQTRCAANWSANSVGACGRHQHVAARDVDLVLQGQGHRVAGRGARQRAVEGDDLLDPRRRATEPITTIGSPGATEPDDDGAGKPAELVVRAIDPLHREAERPVVGAVGRRRSFRDIRAAVGPSIPGRAAASAR